MPEVLGVLSGVMAQHTSTPSRCVFCLWDGWGWLHAKMLTMNPLWSSLARDGPRVHLPGRDYVLLTGPVQAATDVGWWLAPARFQAQSPNLFWPTDRAWCVATEIDFDSTLVAGSRARIDALLNETTLDAWPVHPDDDIAADGDHVNPVR